MTGAESEPVAGEDWGSHKRVLALMAHFRAADAAMRDLPIYNPKAGFEAIGFRLLDQDRLSGVVLTPWFMNLIVLPLNAEPIDMARMGQTVEVPLPAGPRRFAIGGGEEVGLYLSLSLHSPVLTFTLPGQARAEAKRILRLAMQPPETEPEAETPASTSDGVGRRGLLMRRRPG